MRLKIIATLAIIGLALAAWLVRPTAAPEPASPALEQDTDEAHPGALGLEALDAAALSVSERAHVEGPQDSQPPPEEPPTEESTSALSSLRVSVTWRDGTPLSLIHISEPTRPY